MADEDEEEDETDRARRDKASRIECVRRRRPQESDEEGKESCREEESAQLVKVEEARGQGPVIGVEDGGLPIAEEDDEEDDDVNKRGESEPAWLLEQGEPDQLRARQTHMMRQP